MPTTRFISFTLLATASLSFATPLSTDPRRPAYPPTFSVAPLNIPRVPSHDLLNDSYIVMFKEGVQPGVFTSHFSFLQDAHDSNPLDTEDSGLKHVWDAHIKGYAGSFTKDVVEMIRRQPEVDYVEHDQMVYALETQKSAPWGLARISHTDKLNFTTFTKYEFDKHGGEGVNVYVVDTGVYINHTEFEGRARWGKTIPKNDLDIDGNGHGTHCAGTIASKRFGVAKAATITAVKVLGTNGSGTMSDVVAGVVWAAQDAARLAKEALAEFKKTGKTKHKGSVANMSLGGGKSQALDDTVNKAVKAGLHFAVAAGNDNRDACDYSPAGAELAVTVGASTLTDERAYFSNHGKCVDVFAPGLNILSTWNAGPNSVNTISGTSMASPHTAGLLAYLLSIYPSATFDPSVDSSLIPPPLDTTARHDQISFSNAYTMAYNYLPGFLSRVLPTPSLFGEEIDFAPVPPKTLTTTQLKKALIALSNKNVLIDTLPAGTPNKLIFNNATDASGRSWIDDDFWASL